MVAVRMSPNSDMVRSSAIWRSGSTRIAPRDAASRRLFETTSSRKSGTRLAASIKDSRQRDHLRQPDPQAPLRFAKGGSGRGFILAEAQQWPAAARRSPALVVAAGHSRDRPALAAPCNRRHGLDRRTPAGMPSSILVRKPAERKRGTQRSPAGGMR